MTEGIFTWLTQLVESTPLIAFGSAFLWGMLSVILSPCHLSSIPLIVGFISQQEKLTTKKAFYISVLFSTGILITIGAIGFLTSITGRMLGDIGRWGNYFVAIVFFLVGLVLLDIIKINIPGLSGIQMKKRGPWAAFLLGLIFGVALGPCTFAFMAPIIAVAFSTSGTHLTFGIILLLAYGIGHCLVIVLAGTFTKIIQRYLNWNEKSKGTILVKKICGILIIIGGIYIITM